MNIIGLITPNGIQTLLTSSSMIPVFLQVVDFKQKEIKGPIGEKWFVSGISDGIQKLKCFWSHDVYNQIIKIKKSAFNNSIVVLKKYFLFENKIMVQEFESVRSVNNIVGSPVKRVVQSQKNPIQNLSNHQKIEIPQGQNTNQQLNDKDNEQPTNSTNQIIVDLSKCTLIMDLDEKMEQWVLYCRVEKIITNKDNKIIILKDRQHKTISLTFPQKYKEGVKIEKDGFYTLSKGKIERKENGELNIVFIQGTQLKEAIDNGTITKGDKCYIKLQNLKDYKKYQKVSVVGILKKINQKIQNKRHLTIQDPSSDTQCIVTLWGDLSTRITQQWKNKTVKFELFDVNIYQQVHQLSSSRNNDSVVARVFQNSLSKYQIQSNSSNLTSFEELKQKMEIQNRYQSHMKVYLQKIVWEQGALYYWGCTRCKKKYGHCICTVKGAPSGDLLVLNAIFLDSLKKEKIRATLFHDVVLSLLKNAQSEFILNNIYQQNFAKLQNLSKQYEKQQFEAEIQSTNVTQNYQIYLKHVILKITSVVHQPKAQNQPVSVPSRQMDINDN